MTPQQANELLDTDGENLAVRSFLAQYSCDRSITVGAMLAHMSHSGWRGTAPQEILDYRPESPLTKADAADWIRHLFSLERRAPAPTEPAVDRDAVLEEAAIACEKVAAHEGDIDGKTELVWQSAAAIRALKLATPASPAVPGKPLIWQTLTANAFVGYEEYSTYRREIEGLTRRANATPAVPAPAPLAPSDIPEPGYSDSLADRIFNLPCKWKGDARLADAVLMGHTMACEQAFMLAYAASQPTSTPAPAPMHRLICQLASLKSRTPEAVNLLVGEAKRVIGKN